MSRLKNPAKPNTRKKGKKLSKTRQIIESRWFLVFIIAANIMLFSFVFFNIFKLSLDCAKSAVANEQLEHENNLANAVSELEKQAKELENNFIALKKQRKIPLDTKKEIYEKLENLERENRKIEIEIGNYSNDFSISFSPFRNKQIDELILGKSHGFSFKLERLIRNFEASLFLGRISNDQAELIQRDFDALNWQIREVK